MTEQIKISGNDSSDSGVITVWYSHGKHSPLGFEFVRDDGHKQRFAVHAGSVRELLVFLARNS